MDGCPHGLGKFVEVERDASVGFGHRVAGKVDRAKVTDGHFVSRRDFKDFSTEIGKMDRPSRHAGFVTGSIGLVLKCHPAVPGLCQRAHHPCIQLAGLDGFRCKPGLFRFSIGPLEVLSVEISAAWPLDRRGSTSPSASTRFMKRSGIQLARFKLCVRLALSPVLSRSARNSSMSACHGSR